MPGRAPPRSGERAAAPLANPLGDFIAVQFAVSEYGQNQQRRGPLEKLSPDSAWHVVTLPHIAVYRITR